MTRYLLRALGSGLFIIWGAVTLVFIIVRMVPGDQATILLGPDATTEEVEALREELGLNAPLPVQYGLYLLKVLQLDFGDSYRFGQPALELAEFLVDVDPDRLEGPGRRILLRARPEARRLAHDRGELALPVAPGPALR